MLETSMLGKETVALSGLDSLYFETHMDNVLVAIHAACPRDAKDIENGYREIQIVPTCAADLVIFQSRGGMFQIPPKSEILTDCEGDNQRFIVAREVD